MNVEFEDQQYSRVAPTKETGFYAVLFQSGLVKSKGQANIILVILTIVCITGTIFLLKHSTTPPANAPVLTEEDSLRAGNPSEINKNIR